VGIPDEYAGPTVELVVKTVENLVCGAKGMWIFVVPTLGGEVWTVDDVTGDTTAVFESNMKMQDSSPSADELNKYATKFRTTSLGVKIYPTGPLLYRAGTVLGTRFSTDVDDFYLGKGTTAGATNRYRCIDSFKTNRSILAAGAEGRVLSATDPLIATARPKGAVRQFWNVEEFLPSWKQDTEQTVDAFTTWSATSQTMSGYDESFGAILLNIEGVSTSANSFQIEVTHCVQIQPWVGNGLIRSLAKRAPAPDTKAVEAASVVHSDSPPVETEPNYVARTAGWLARFGLDAAAYAARRYAPGIGGAVINTMDSFVNRMIAPRVGNLSITN